MFSLGKNASNKTENSGRQTTAAISKAKIDHPLKPRRDAAGLSVPGGSSPKERPPPQATWVVIRLASVVVANPVNQFASQCALCCDVCH